MKGISVDLVIWNEDDSVYRQTLQDDDHGRHRRQPGSERWSTSRAASSSAAASKCRKRIGRCCRRWRESFCSDDAGTLTEQVERRGRGEVSIPALKPRRGGPETAPLAETSAAGLGILQRPGRLQPRRTRVRHLAQPRADHARAVGQRDRQPAVRHGRVGKRKRLHLVGEQPRIPLDSLVQRPGYGRERRGHLHPRRGKRSFLVALALLRLAAKCLTSPGMVLATPSSNHAEDGIVSELCLFVAVD